MDIGAMVTGMLETCSEADLGVFSKLKVLDLGWTADGVPSVQQVISSHFRAEMSIDTLRSHCR